MTEYKDNKAYEADKASAIEVLGQHVKGTRILGTCDVFVTWNLLKQSQWIDNYGERPLPVVKDKNGKLVKDYSICDWFSKLVEELDEVKMASTLSDLAEELQDLITVATSIQAVFLGLNEKERIDICNKVNEKNLKRGYLSV